MKERIDNNIAKFWNKKSNLIFWQKNPKKIFRFNKKNLNYEWFYDGKTNICYNCLDRNVKEGLKNKVAIHTIKENGEIDSYTYYELLKLVDNFSEFLVKNFKGKLKKVMIHSSASIESSISMLACMRLGVTHNVIFEDLELDAIEVRAKLFKPDLFISRSQVKINNLKERCKNLKFLLLNKEIKKDKKNLQFNISKITKSNYVIKTRCKFLNSINESFVLFTSGSTGLPKGVVHTTGGYLVFAKYSCLENFGMNKNSVVFTASDAGWINGHTYALYGPLSIGATTILIEKPTSILDENILKKIILNLKPSIMYLPVTLIRILKSLDFKLAKSSYLKTLGSMGEPLAPEVAKWFAAFCGLKNKTIVNTYFQTETGGIITAPKFNDKLSNTPFGTVGKPEKIFKLSLKKIDKSNKSEIIIENPWPGCMINVVNERKVWKKYWNKKYHFRLFDSGSFDKFGNLIIHGRTDDVINIRGHRIGSAEIEAILLKNKIAVEVCAVATDDFLEGSVLNIFLVISKGEKKIDHIIKKDLISNFGSFALPKKIVYLDELPKTKSGKILRRLLRDLLEKKEKLGDLSTLINKGIVENIKKKI